VSAVVKPVANAVKTVVIADVKAQGSVLKGLVKVARVTACVADSFWPTNPSLGATGVTTGAGFMGTGVFLLRGSGVVGGVIGIGIASGGTAFLVAGAVIIGYGAYEYFKEC
jgi:hypothetical protein